MTSAAPQPRPAGEGGTLLQLAARVRRLCPDRRDPERFHVEKDAIEKALRRLAHARDLR